MALEGLVILGKIMSIFPLASKIAATPLIMCAANGSN